MSSRLRRTTALVGLAVAALVAAGQGCSAPPLVDAASSSGGGGAHPTGGNGDAHGTGGNGGAAGGGGAGLGGAASRPRSTPRPATT
jgi:hypothetical protein